MTKEEKIQEAYGENWELVKNNVNQKGWIKDREFDFKDFKPMKWETTDHDDEWYDTRRPIELKGIENNNGWIKIESEDWLKEHKIDDSRTKFYVDNKDEDYLTIAVLVVFHDEQLILTLSDYYFIKEDVIATHYQPIVNPQPPIY